jgi:cytochrome c1
MASDQEMNMTTSTRRFARHSIGAVLAVLLTVPASAAPAASPTKSDPMALARGAKAWSDNCVRCHNMRDPRDYRDDQWISVMQHMRLRAGLTGQEARDILKFLQGSN